MTALGHDSKWWVPSFAGRAKEAKKMSSQRVASGLVGNGGEQRANSAFCLFRVQGPQLPGPTKCSTLPRAAWRVLGARLALDFRLFLMLPDCSSK